MTSRLFYSTAAFLIASALVLGQGRGGAPNEPSVWRHFSSVQQAEIPAPEIPGVVKAGSKVILIKHDLRGGEGVLALPDNSGTLFTERDAFKVSKIDKDDNITTYMENTEGALGLGMDHKGRLIATRGGLLVLLAPTRSTLVDSFEGKRASANDLVIDKDNGVFFSNSPNILYLRPDGQIIKVASDVVGGGIQLSPDEKTVYAVQRPQTGEPEILAFDVQPDRMLTNRRHFVYSGGDGMAMDSAGRLYICVPGSWYKVNETIGVRVVSPQGKDLGMIPTGLTPNSVGFGGPDRRTLYIVGRRNGLQKIQLLSQGIMTRGK